MATDDHTLAALHAENLALRERIQDLEHTMVAADHHLRLFRLLFEHSSEPMFVLEAGRFTECNRATLTLFGVTQKDAILGRSPIDLSPEHQPDGRLSTAAAQEMIATALQQGSVRFEWVHTLLDGTPFTADIFLNVISLADTPIIYGSWRDVSDRKRQEEERQLFQTLADIAPDGFGMATFDGVIVYANAAYRAMTGYGDALIGMRFIDHFSPQHQAQAIEAFTATRGQRTWRGILQFQRKDGTELPVEASGFAARNRDGEISRVVGIFRDISAQQRADAERAALQQQVIDAQRDALRELSTPLIPITDGVVIMPLIGTIDSQRAQMAMETLLEGVARHQAEQVILDITGVTLVDTQVAQALVQAAQAVKLLGARVLLTGIQPQMAQTLVELGAAVSGMETYGTLQSGMLAALQRTQARLAR